MHVLFASGQIAILSGRDADSQPLLEVFERVSEQQSWQPGDDLRADTRNAIYFAVQKSGEVVGGIKLVVGAQNGMPVTRVWPELGLDGREDVADLALLAFNAEHRGDLTALWAVGVEMWRHCACNGVREIWAELPERNLRLYRRIGWPFEVRGALRDHWGEPCWPCSMGVDDVHRVVAARAARSPLFATALAQAFRDEELA